MHSMTGFGRGRKISSAGTLEAQVACINKRGLEISVALPRELSLIEGELYELLKGSFERGKLQLTLRLETKKQIISTKSTQLHVEAKFNELKKLCRRLKVPFEANAELLADLMRSGEFSNNGAIDIEKLRPTALAATRDSIKNCLRAQTQEGMRLQKDFLSRLKKLEDLRAQALVKSVHTVELQRERLLKNLSQAGLTINTGDERVLKELALFADRVDITEELTRINSHLTAARKLISSTGAIGRQLEFLLQEFLREWNTLGNKSPQIELVQVALSAKNEIEKMREQAANVV